MSNQQAHAGVHDFTVMVTNAELHGLQELAASYGTSATMIVEAFVADLTRSVRNGGSDERLFAEQWFQRCLAPAGDDFADEEFAERTSAQQAAQNQALYLIDSRPIYASKKGDTIMIGATTLLRIDDQPSQQHALLITDHPGPPLKVSTEQATKLRQFMETGIADTDG